MTSMLIRGKGFVLFTFLGSLMSKLNPIFGMLLLCPKFCPHACLHSWNNGFTKLIFMDWLISSLIDIFELILPYWDTDL